MAPEVACEILVIGAGPAGIGAAIKLKEHGFEDLIVLEAADEVGGTWRDCVYPGLACDIPALTFSYSYDQKPDWTNLWAPQPEILEYLKDCVDRHGLRSRVRFGQEVVESEYDEDANLWTTSTADGSRYASRYVVTATGFLNVPRWPDFPGLGEYRGQKVHTNAWPEDLDLTGKRVALIGTGATAIQVAPEIAPIVSQLHVFQRTPIWLLPKIPLRVPKSLQFAFRWIPGLQRTMRLMTAAFMDLVFWRAFTNYGQVRPMARFVERTARKHIRKQVDDPAVADALTPRYSWACKRPSFSNAFYPIFNRENVDLVTDPIKGLTETGIVTEDGTERPIDVLICATGYRPFEKGSLPTYPVRGRQSESLGEYWEEHRYQAFRGFAVNGYPNFFLVFGPYSVASTSYFAMIEREVENIVRVLEAVRKEGANFAEVRADAQAEDWKQTLSKKGTSVWATANCGSSNTYYLDSHGDTPLFRPTYHPGEWWRARRLNVGANFDVERRGSELAQPSSRDDRKPVSSR